MLKFCKIYYVREKNVEMYFLFNWFGGYKFKIEVVIVIDLKYWEKIGMLVWNGVLRIEILVLFEILFISLFEEEIKFYVWYIW